MGVLRATLPDRLKNQHHRKTGAFGAAILAVGVNVVSERINHSLEAEQSATCPAKAKGTPVGHEGLEIWLSPLGESCWVPSLNSLRPGDEFDVRIYYFNATGETTTDVAVQAYLPDNIDLVGGSSQLKNANNPDGKVISNHILDPGINIGGYTNGSNAWLKFTARIGEGFDAPCGEITVHPVSA